ncbi:MAG: condensation domain-containing protein [Chloroflexi bacterium]|nr:condensation domain-containing protein [Chloroflexota bacterium]
MFKTSTSFPPQQGMLFHTLKQPHTGIYVVQLACKLTGSLHDDIFEQAWQKITARHPIFRTAFYWKEADKPLQVVYKQVTTPVHHLDWRDLSASEQTARLSVFLDDDRRQGFLLDKPPAARDADPPGRGGVSTGLELPSPAAGWLVTGAGAA